jgi:hypothetical protein
MMPHNSQAGKNAPNRSKEGALPPEQPVRVMHSKDRRANIAFALGKIICRLSIRLAHHSTVDAIKSTPENIINSCPRRSDSNDPRNLQSRVYLIGESLDK